MLVPEVISDLAETWLAEHASGGLAISRWTETEIASALARKQRSDRIDVAGRLRGVELWRALSKSVTRVEIVPDDFSRAACLVDSGARGLRASDALHLAIMLRLELELATYDRDLAEAARAEGVTVASGPPDA